MISFASRSGAQPARRLNVALILLTLAACGGGGGGGGGGGADAPTPPAQVQAADDSYTLDWNKSSLLKVTDNDSQAGSAAVSLQTAPQFGKAEVLNGAISYTPQAQYFGPDSFSYTLSLDGRSSTATVRVTVEASVTLQGQASLPVSANPVRALAAAQVQLRVGAQTQTVAAAADGSYALTLKTSRPTDYLRVTVTGQGADAPIALSSLIGEAGRVLKDSRDGRLDTSQQPALMPDAVTAAVAGLIEQSGTSIASDADYLAALERLDVQRVADAAVLARVMAASPPLLPAGVTLQQVLGSTASYQQADALYRQQVSGSARQSNFWELATDRRLRRAPPVPASAAEPLEWVLSFGNESGAAPARRVSLRADGSGSELRDALRPLRWTRDAQGLQLQYEQPQVTVLRPNSSDFVEVGTVGVEPHWAYPKRVTITGVLVADFRSNGSRLNLAVVESQATVELQINGVWTLEDRITSPELMRRGGTQGFQASEFAVGSRRAGLISAAFLNGEPYAGEFQDIFKVTGPGAAVFERTGETVSWSLRTDGSLLVTLRGLRTRYSRLGHGVHGEERWLLEVLADDGSPTRNAEVAVVPVQQPSLSRADWTRVWTSNINGDAGEPIVFTLNDDARAFAITQRRSDDVQFVSRRYWRWLADGRVELVQAEQSSCVVFQANGTAGPLPCPLFQQRFWTPVARSGKTLWVLQEGPVVLSDPGYGHRWRLIALTSL